VQLPQAECEQQGGDPQYLGDGSFCDACPCQGDCGNGDGTVDDEDFMALLNQWGQAGTSCDLNGGGVNVTDFLSLLQHWGPCR
jgi:hypothetical protein